MRAENIKCGWAFTGNPIVITDATDCRERNAGKVFVSFRRNDDAWYTGMSHWPLSINIAEIVEAYTPYFPEASVEDGITLEYLEDVSEVTDIRGVSISAITPDGNKLQPISFLAIRGGVSCQNLRKYAAAETDVFDSRLLRTDGNFFLTTRSAGWSIAVKESELMPLYFIPGQDFELSVRAVTSGLVLMLNRVDKFGVYALNPIGVRRSFFEAFGEIPSILDILADGKPASRIVIEKSMPALESYRLKFRNSFGVFEVMELQGHLKMTGSESESGDDLTYNRYDPVIDDFTRNRPRIALPFAYELSSGKMSHDEILFLRGVLASEEVYLLDVYGAPVRVIPDCERFNLAYRSMTPEEMTITLRPVGDECRIMPDIDGVSTNRWRRLFTDEFTNEFD